VKIHYRPSDWQTRFHLLDTNEALGAGAAGPGKSFCLSMDPIQQLRVEDARMHCDPRSVTHPEDPLWNQILENPIAHGESQGWALFLMRTSPRLEQRIAKMRTVFLAMDPHVKEDRQQSIFTFSCGFRYQFGHCHLFNDFERYMSSEYSWIGFDELVHFEEEQYFQIKSRLRSSDPVMRGMVKTRAMSNPVMRLEANETFVNRNPQWVREYFVDPAPEGNTLIVSEATDENGEVFENTRIYLPAKLDDNPDKEFVETYKRNLLHSKPHMRKALLEGDWYLTPGSFFEDVWDPQMTIIRPFAVPDDWPVFRSMDWGYKAKGCIHWWTLDPDDNLIGIREFTFQKRLALQVAEDTRAAEKAMGLWGYRGSRITGPADTQLWEDRGGSGRTKAEDFASVGINWVQANKKSRKRNARFMTERLHATMTRRRKGGLYLFSSCIMLARTIPAMQSNKEDMEEPADGGEDHWLDSAFYACNYASYGRSGVPRMDSRFRPDDDDEPEDFRGRLGYGI